MRQLAWSQVKAATEPGLALEVRLLIELLRVLPDGHALAGPLRLRPSNILVGTDGSVCVGAASEQDAEVQQRYLAPEVRAGGAIDAPALVYAVGVLLFEAITGHDFESPELIQLELFGARAVARAAGLGQQFWEIYLLEASAKATSEAIESRWPTLKQFARDLERVAPERVAKRERLGELVVRAEQISKSVSQARPRPIKRATPGRGRPAVKSTSAMTRSLSPRGLPAIVDRKRTLVGLGFNVNQSEVAPTVREEPGATHAEPAGLEPDTAPLILSKRQAEPEHVESVEESLPLASIEAVASDLPAEFPDAASVSNSPSYLGELAETGSAVTTYPQQKSRTVRWLVITLMVLIASGLGAEYYAGYLSRTLAGVVPPQVLRWLPTRAPRAESELPLSPGSESSEIEAEATSPKKEPADATPAVSASATEPDLAAPSAAPEASAGCEGCVAPVESGQPGQLLEPESPKRSPARPVPRPRPGTVAEPPRKAPKDDRDYGI